MEILLIKDRVSRSHNQCLLFQILQFNWLRDLIRSIRIAFLGILGIHPLISNPQLRYGGGDESCSSSDDEIEEDEKEEEEEVDEDVDRRDSNSGNEDEGGYPELWGSVVKAWDGPELSGGGWMDSNSVAWIGSREKGSENVGVEVWDMRVGENAPIMFAEWRTQPRRRVVGVAGGRGNGLVYVGLDDGSVAEVDLRRWDGSPVTV